MTLLIVVLALVVIGAFYFGMRPMGRLRRMLHPLVKNYPFFSGKAAPRPVNYDVHKEHGGVMAKLKKLAGNAEEEKPERRWPVEAGDLVCSMEPVALLGDHVIRTNEFGDGVPSKPSARDAFHLTRSFGRVTERISPTRVKVLFDGDLEPSRRRVSALTMVRKARPMPDAA